MIKNADLENDRDIFESNNKNRIKKGSSPLDPDARRPFSSGPSCPLRVILRHFLMGLNKTSEQFNEICFRAEAF